MSRCERKRFLAFMLTVAMLLGVMPVDLLGGIASVKAAETVHEVNFTKLPAEGKKDTDPFTNDMMADSYYALVGSAMCRLNSEATKVKAVELSNKEGKSAINFTVSGTATLEVKFSSTGGGKTSKLALKKDGTQIADSVKEATGTTGETVTYSNLATGTYSIISAEGFTERSVRIISIKVTETSQDVPAGATVSGNIAVVDNTNGLVQEGQKVSLTAAENKDTVELAVGVENEDITLSAGTKYNIVAPNENVRAVAEDGKTTITTGTEAFSTTITLGKAKVEALVKLAEGSELENGATLTLINTADAGDTVQLTPNGTVPLKVGATYEISTSMALADAKVNGEKTVTVTEETTELIISIESTQVATTITVKDADGLLGDGAVTLTNMKDTADVHSFKSGEAVSLTIGEVYKVSCAVNNAIIKINNSTIYKASRETTNANVVISAKDADLHELDLSGGLLKGQTYEGGISVLADMPYTSNTLEACGVLYEGTVQTPKENPSPNNGAIPTTGAAVKLVAEKAGKLKVTVSLVNKVYYFLEETANGPKEVLKFDNTTNTQTGGKVLILPVEAGKTYYLYTHGSKIKMYGITVDYKTSLDWNKIETPVLGTPSVKGGTISVPYTAQVGGIYAETLDVTMYDANGKAVNKQSITTEGESGVAEFTPAASGTYSFKAELIRTGEASKVSNTTTSVNFVLPMATPAGLNAENKGHGNVKLTWQAVPEAENYTVYVDGKVYAEGVTKLLQKISGLTVGQEYTFGVAAVRGNDISKPAEVKLTITEDAVKTWNYSAFGSSVDTMSEGGKNNGFSGSYDTQDLKVWSMNSKGKLVPNSTDGVAFYYTTIDPETENFTLSADVTVDSWKFTNGQEGFGLMAADRVGENGSGNSFWNNSYMVSATKVEYFWDAEAGQVSDAGDKYTMKLGVGSQEKIGVTPENLAADTVVDDFQTAMRTLETSAVASGQGAGTYNMVGGYEAALKDITDVNPQTTFHMTIQRNNTGYFLSYTNAATGETVTNKYYHGDNGDELTRLDENNIYVGFYASRSAKVSFSNMSLTTVAPENDAPAEARPITYVTPNFSIESAKVANNANYEMVYYGNADGVLSITNSKGEAVVSGQHVDAKTKFRVNTVLEQGSNTFAVEFTPDADYKPAKYSLLSSYDTVKFDFNVTYNVKDRSYIYVSPDGRSYGSGAKDDPVDIYTAVKSAAPGRTILLKGGTYALDKTVIVERGVNGTADAKIYMIADPEAATRPVLDFQGRCAGMILAGDYWYFQGFDVTRSANAQKGIQVSGSYNTVDNVVTYKNGNTGLQISRYKSTDNWEDWPSYNLILNCTSYLNADAGYEDADGFAAKLTIGEGNVFDGCIAAYNADDGWDLFAKVETGAIGQVVIQNCVAFKNGYVLDENGQEVDAGNGNGFKMGGSSISGHHILRNSVSFGNKAKGIDSNSCPDIEAYSSTSYNNESFNVAFYTNDAKNTAFIAKGILSFKDSSNAAGQTVAEQFKPKGTQETSAYENAMNYYWRGENSTNSEGIAATAEWFQNMDMNSAIHGGIRRNTDGTINMNGFLAVTSAVPEGVGARMTGTPSAVFTVAADVVNNDDDDDDDNSGSSAAPAVDWTDVSNSVQDKVAEMMKNPAIASVNMNFVCSGEVKVPQNVLNTIKGTKLTVAFHSGNGVALSISGQDLKNKDLSKIQNIDLTVDQTSNTIPANVVSAKSGTVNRQLGIRDTGSFGVNVNIHVNVGKDNSGKSANLYRYNTEKGRLEYCGSFTVTSTGQSMFALKRGGNYLVTVTDRRPSESIWYTEGGYTVKSGDTLSRIAKKNHMTLAQLLRRNVQITNQNVIRVGQKLNLD